MALLAIIVGLVILVIAADRFVLGAAATAFHFDVSPLFVGMVIVGFGTSAPEMFVSGMSAMDGNAGIALGNAYGSNITNIALILGVTALIKPISVHSNVIRRELPILMMTLPLVALQLWNNHLSRLEGGILMAAMAGVMLWGYINDKKSPNDTLADEIDEELGGSEMSLPASLGWMAAGLVGLMLSSRMLVWGAVEIAQAFGVSDLLIGLTIVSIGTSFPELAASVVAAKKGEHDLAIGNVVGSNMFNTLVVVGIAALIKPFDADPVVLARDVPVMSALTVLLFALAYGFRGPGRLNRIEGGVLILAYIGYTTYLVFDAMAAAGA